MPESTQEWPPGMDALVAAPSHHRLKMENEHVRVLETRIEPGDTVPMHTHQWPATNYVLSWSDFIRRDENGQVLLDTKASGVKLEPGQAVWAAPLPLHTLENVGSGTL